MDWLNPSTFSVNPWTAPAKPTAPYRPDFADDEGLKEQFGVAIGKGLSTFDAGMEILKELPKALWASINWANDPVVVAAKDVYQATLKRLQKSLDKEALLAKVLELVDEKVLDKNGVEVPLVEAKVRVDALKLYSEISGFTGRVNIDASTNFNQNNTTNNLMKITLVKPDSKDAPKVIEASNIKSKIQNEEIFPIQLKLVGGSSR